MNRGDRREPIVHSEADRALWIQTLGDACQKTGWQVHAYCLMVNHFHLVLETPRANLSRGMQWFLGTYTNRLNRRHRLCGHLFSGRYKALVVDGSGEGYFRRVCDYVHLNPVRAGLLAPDQPLRQYGWSSFALYLGPASRRPQWLRVDRLLGEHGLPQDTPSSRLELERIVEARRVQDSQPDDERIRRGWYFGEMPLRARLLELIALDQSSSHAGEEIRESEAARAERLVQVELGKRSWTEEDLVERKKTDPEKARLAVRLRRETTMCWQWIATRLHMGAWRTARNSVVALDGT
jgi:REP element-mobilizing transposase RayT